MVSLFGLVKSLVVAFDGVSECVDVEIGGELDGRTIERYRSEARVEGRGALRGPWAHAVSWSFDSATKVMCLRFWLVMGGEEGIMARGGDAR